MRQKIWILLGLSLIVGSFNASTTRVLAQGAETAADQSAFQDDEELMRLNGAQVNQVQGEVMNAEQQAAYDDKRNQAYRLYAEKKIQELEKIKASSPDNARQIGVLQRWLKADAAMRMRDQQTINSLRQRLANIEQTQNQTMTNLGGDVSAMREAANDARADDMFRQQMSINYFNELQSEMGPANWTHSSRGPSYGMGGYGFSGGQALFGGGY